MGEHLLEIYLVGATIVCLYFLALSAANVIAFRRLSLRVRKLGSPKVSVLIPARNEEDNLGPLLDSLLDQDYSNYEILVLDDNSTDRTGEILRDYAERHPEVTALAGKPLPDGWLGKNYACHQLTEKADGDYLMLTDADTVHGPRSISWAMTNMLDHKADFMSAYTRQRIGSFGEALIVPGIYLVTAFFLPIWLIPRTRRASISFAIGQFVIGLSEAFRTVGGYAKIKDSVIDDIAMVRNMKAAGLKTLFLDGSDHIDCRMYPGFRGAFSGLIKNTYAAIGKKLSVLLALILMIVFVIELPLLNLVYRAATGADQLLLSAVPVAVFFLMWLLTVVDRKLNPAIAFLYPLLFLNLIVIASVSTARTGYGKGTLWKNRRVR